MLDDPAVQGLLTSRLARLEPDRPPLWGRMTAHQMVCHLNDSFKVAMGERYASPASSFLQRTLIKWVALRTNVTWPRGVPTRPEVDQHAGGTRPLEFRRDLAELEALMARFAERPRRFAFAPHPTFGTMSDADWMRWGYKHVSHHLQQFGL